jgi:uncharacterized small protein (DUF1192 family)
VTKNREGVDSGVRRCAAGLRLAAGIVVLLAGSAAGGIGAARASVAAVGGAAEAGGAAGADAASPQTGAAGNTPEDRLKALESQIAALKAEIDRLRAGASSAGARTIAEIEKQIDALTREIERLKIGAAAAPEAEGSVLGFGPAASKVYRVQRGVSIGGYGEMLYQNYTSTKDNDTPANAPSEVDFLRAVLYFGYKFEDRFLFNSEIEYEHAQAGEGKAGEVSVEFAYLDFRARKEFGARGGVLLVPVGFLNELHEPPIFHGARRPQVEQVILPSTWRENGIGAYGDAGPVSWRAYVVAGLKSSGFSESSWIRGGRQSAAKSRATDLGFTARVDWTPVPGLLVGASGFTGKTGQSVEVTLDMDGDPVTPAVTSGFPDGRLSLWDAHIEYNVKGWRLRGLIARGILGDAGEIGALIDSNATTAGVQPSAIGERAFGWYVEGAYNVFAGGGFGGQELSPFCRYEAYNTQDQVAPGFTANPANDVTVRTCGVTYRPIPNIAIKADAMNFNNQAQTAIDQVNFALGYLF